LNIALIVLYATNKAKFAIQSQEDKNLSSFLGFDVLYILVADIVISVRIY